MGMLLCRCQAYAYLCIEKIMTALVVYINLVSTCNTRFNVVFYKTRVQFQHTDYDCVQHNYIYIKYTFYDPNHKYCTLCAT